MNLLLCPVLMTFLKMSPALRSPLERSINVDTWRLLPNIVFILRIFEQSENKPIYSAPFLFQYNILEVIIVIAKHIKSMLLKVNL